MGATRKAQFCLPVQTGLRGQSGTDLIPSGLVRLGIVAAGLWVSLPRSWLGDASSMSRVESGTHHVIIPNYLVTYQLPSAPLPDSSKILVHLVHTCPNIHPGVESSCPVYVGSLRCVNAVSVRLFFLPPTPPTSGFFTHHLAKMVLNCELK